MSQHARLIESFYLAFNNRDFLTMQRAYHDQAQFHDPVFLHLSAEEVKYMWQMLLTQAKDLRVSCSEIKVSGEKGSCRWDAWYTFSKTGRKVHNIIYAEFEFRDGLIYRHHDVFDLWRWSKQAMGVTGSLLGWSYYVRKKIQRAAKRSLDIYMHAHKLAVHT